MAGIGFCGTAQMLRASVFGNQPINGTTDQAAASNTNQHD